MSYLKDGSTYLTKDGRHVTIEAHIWGDDYLTTDEQVVSKADLIVPRGGRRTGAGRPRGSEANRRSVVMRLTEEEASWIAARRREDDSC